MWARLLRVIALLRDPRTPKLPRLAVALAILYFIWPFDLLPDFFVPVAGYLDDAVVIWMSLRWLLNSGDKVARELPGPPVSGGPPVRGGTPPRR
jgi:uncharacterized membrane protein YkvA (DUF1232 family)